MIVCTIVDDQWARPAGDRAPNEVTGVRSRFPGRLTAVLGVVVVLGMTVPTAASAAGSATVTSPAANAPLSSTTAIQVSVSGSSGVFGGNHRVQVRLGRLDQSAVPGTAVVDLACTGGNCGGDGTWGGVNFNPVTLSPFLDTTTCNGGYLLQTRVDDGSWTSHPIHVRLPAPAPSGLSAEGDVTSAEIDWTPASAPDLVGQVVQRRLDGGSWQAVAELGTGVASWTDGDAPAGAVQYRVSSSRPDGVVNGSPATPCQDTAPDLVAWSSAASTTVTEAPDPSESPTTPSRPRPTPSDDDGQPSTGDGGSEEPTDGGTDGDGGSGDGGTGGDGGSDGDGGEPTDGGTGEPTDQPTTSGPVTRRAGDRVAPPSASDPAARPQVALPSLPRDDPSEGEDREDDELYYGEGGPFSEELDFGGLGEPEAGPEDFGPETQVVRIPGALQSVLGTELEVKRIVEPLALGMLLLTVALHLRRWTHAGAID